MDSFLALSCHPLFLPRQELGQAEQGAWDRGPAQESPPCLPGCHVRLLSVCPNCQKTHGHLVLDGHLLEHPGVHTGTDSDRDPCPGGSQAKRDTTDTYTQDVNTGRGTPSRDADGRGAEGRGAAWSSIALRGSLCGEPGERGMVQDGLAVAQPRRDSGERAQRAVDLAQGGKGRSCGWRGAERSEGQRTRQKVQEEAQSSWREAELSLL